LKTENDNSNNNNINDRSGMKENDDNDVDVDKKHTRSITWTKSPDDEAEYADWKIDVVFIPTNDLDNNDKGESEIEKMAEEDCSSTTTVKTKTTTSVIATYSVHRLPLGEKSGYFKKLFTDEQSSEPNEERQCRHSTIELPSPAITIAHFETLLDYFYQEDALFTMEQEDADTMMVMMAMVYFGDQLGIPQLKKKAHKVLELMLLTCTNMNIDGVVDNNHESAVKFSKIFATLYKAGKQLTNMKDLQNAIIYVCAGQSIVMSKGTELSTNMKCVDLQFWCRVLLLVGKMNYSSTSTKPNHDEQQRKCNSMNWSENVAHFIEHQNLSDVDYGSFYALTQIDTLPFISPKVAILLMQQEQHFSSQRLMLGMNKEQDDVTLTPLQQRCIDALYNKDTRAWQISGIRHEIQQGKLRKISPIVLETLLLHMMECTDFTRRLLPTSVTISGAGNECVNGIYTTSGWHNEKLFFTKPNGIYDGQHANVSPPRKGKSKAKTTAGQFIIYSHSITTEFVISFFPDGEDFHSAYVTTLYGYACSSESTKTPIPREILGNEHGPDVQSAHDMYNGIFPTPRLSLNY